MGREMKRVPMDFAWPLGTVWGGYINPFYKQAAPCPACEGSGYSSEAKLFQEQWYGKAPFDPVAYGAVPLSPESSVLRTFAERQCERTPEYYGTGEYAVRREMQRLYEHWRNQWSHHLIQADVDALLASGRLMDFTHVPRTDEQREIVKAKVAAGGNSWLPESNGYQPTAEEVNAWSLVGFGHDAINMGVCVEARCAREGVSETCEVCSSNEDALIWPSPEIHEAYKAWTETEPPTGAGFQLWETTSEGSPQSPVFETIELLCAWCADNATTFGSNKTSAEQWRKMLDADFVVHREGNLMFL
jgi:hypothetical protein